MHVCGVAVAMLSLDRKVDGLIDIIHPDNRQNRHHQLVLHKGMVKAGLTDLSLIHIF